MSRPSEVAAIRYASRAPELEPQKTQTLLIKGLHPPDTPRLMMQVHRPAHIRRERLLQGKGVRRRPMHLQLAEPRQPFLHARPVIVADPPQRLIGTVRLGEQLPVA